MMNKYMNYFKWDINFEFTFFKTPITFKTVIKHKNPKIIGSVTSHKK